MKSSECGAFIRKCCRNPRSCSALTGTPADWRRVFQKVRKLSGGERLRAEDRNSISEQEALLLRKQLLLFFRRRLPCPAEDLAYETMTRLIERVRNTEVRDRARFALGTAKNVFLEYLRSSVGNARRELLQTARSRVSR